MDELEAREPEMKGEDGGKTKGVNTFVISIPVYDACHLCFPHSLSLSFVASHIHNYSKSCRSLLLMCARIHPRPCLCSLHMQIHTTCLWFIICTNTKMCDVVSNMPWYSAVWWFSVRSMCNVHRHHYHSLFILIVMMTVMPKISTIRYRWIDALCVARHTITLDRQL